MSKQSRKKARKRKQRRQQVLTLLCPACGARDDGSPGAILTAIADALNLAADNGLKVRLHHGIAEVRGNSSGGFILPLRDGRWTPRDQQYDRLAPVLTLDEDLD